MSLENSIVPRIKKRDSESMKSEAYILSAIIEKFLGFAKDIKGYIEREIFFDFNTLPADKLLELNTEFAEIEKEYAKSLRRSDLYLLKKEIAQELLDGQSIVKASLRMRASLMSIRRQMGI